MMFDELQLLLSNVCEESASRDYEKAIVENNVLGKPTKAARSLTFRHLSTLYGLDRSNVLFRTLRRFWQYDDAARPILALMVALARDPLLRTSESFILSLPNGSLLLRQDVEDFIGTTFPDRFSQASLKSFAQNISATWTKAGFLKGHRNKTRTNPAIFPEHVTFALFMGYLEGLSGQRLFSSKWTKLLGLSDHELVQLVTEAAQRGFLVFMNAGGVKEVRFMDYLTQDEEMIRQEVGHVV